MNLEINIFIWKGFEQCVRGEASHLAIKILKLLTFFKRRQILKQEWQKSPARTRQTDGKNMVWFGEIEKKISQIIKDYLFLPFFLLIILWSYCTCTLHLFSLSSSTCPTRPSNLKNFSLKKLVKLIKTHQAHPPSSSSS